MVGFDFIVKQPENHQSLAVKSRHGCVVVLGGRQPTGVLRLATAAFFLASFLPLLKLFDYKTELHKVVDWSEVDKEDYLLAMERSPIRDIEIKHILKNALTDDVCGCDVYMKGIDHSYYYEGYAAFKTEEL